MIDTVFSFVMNFQIIYLVKLFLFVLALFYFVYGLVVYRQVSLMSSVIETSMTPLAKFLTVIQILLATGIFAMIILLV